VGCQARCRPRSAPSAEPPGYPRRRTSAGPAAGIASPAARGDGRALWHVPPCVAEQADSQRWPSDPGIAGRVDGRAGRPAERRTCVRRSRASGSLKLQVAAVAQRFVCCNLRPTEGGQARGGDGVLQTGGRSRPSCASMENGWCSLSWSGGPGSRPGHRAPRLPRPFVCGLDVPRRPPRPHRARRSWPRRVGGWHDSRSPSRADRESVARLESGLPGEQSAAPHQMGFLDVSALSPARGGGTAPAGWAIRRRPRPVWPTGDCRRPRPPPPPPSGPTGPVLPLGAARPVHGPVVATRAGRYPS